SCCSPSGARSRAENRSSSRPWSPPSPWSPSPSCSASPCSPMGSRIPRGADQCPSVLGDSTPFARARRMAQTLPSIGMPSDRAASHWHGQGPGRRSVTLEVLDVVELEDRTRRKLASLVAVVVAIAWSSAPLPAAAEPVRVTVDNFRRAETDAYFTRFVAQGGFGKFQHERELASIDNQAVIRLNRDTLYSFGVFDLAAGPVTITLPDAG